MTFSRHPLQPVAVVKIIPGSPRSMHDLQQIPVTTPSTRFSGLSIIPSTQQWGPVRQSAWWRVGGYGEELRIRPF